MGSEGASLAVGIVIEVLVSIGVIVGIVVVVYCCCCKKAPKPVFPQPIPDRPLFVALVKNPNLAEISSVDAAGTNGVYRVIFAGGWYEGPLVNGIMQGEGRFYYNSSGGLYVGGFFFFFSLF
jgi:hypothetical protein